MGRSKRTADIQELLRARGGEAVAFLASLMEDPGAKPELRLKAAEKLLDRALEHRESTGGRVEILRFEGELEEWSR